MIVFAARGCGILHNLFRSRGDLRPVLVPVNVCEVVPLTLEAAGNLVEFVDIDATTLAIDEGACIQRVAGNPERYAGVVFVRPYGAHVDCSKLFGALRAIQSNIILVDDACLAEPDLEGRNVKADADATLFSTGPRKNVDLGHGAFAHVAAGVRYQTHEVSSSESLAKRIGTFPPFDGSVGQLKDPRCWLNSGRLQGSPAAYARAIALALRDARIQKTKLNSIYAAGIPMRFQLEEIFQSWRFNILVDHPDGLCMELHRRGLFAGRHFQSLKSGVESESFPVTASLAAKVVNLFNDRYYDEARAMGTVECVREFCM